MEDLTFWSLDTCLCFLILPLFIPDIQNKSCALRLFLVSNTYMIQLTHKDNIFIHSMSFNVNST
jgi:hypothetical protein